jgi:hypothetical protein
MSAYVDLNPHVLALFLLVSDLDVVDFFLCCQ